MNLKVQVPPGRKQAKVDQNGRESMSIVSICDVCKVHISRYKCVFIEFFDRKLF